MQLGKVVPESTVQRLTDTDLQACHVAGTSTASDWEGATEAGSNADFFKTQLWYKIGWLFSSKQARTPPVMRESINGTGKCKANLLTELPMLSVGLDSCNKQQI